MTTQTCDGDCLSCNIDTCLACYRQLYPDQYPGICEYQKRWETCCRDQTSTDATQMTKHVSYSCALFFCKYPERKCEVKKE
jgi:hypothetical protein